MGRTWVLDTETKGTGAQMVPLDKVLTQPAPSTEPFFVPPKRTPPEPKPPEPREPRRFRIVDVATRSVLADDAPARAALEVLGDVRSSVDVHVFVWAPGTEEWRLLTLGEQRAMWVRRRAAR
jgi:hypothetical protein